MEIEFTQSSMNPSMQLEKKACIYPCNRACIKETMYSSMNFAYNCEYGFNQNQLCVLSVIKRNSKFPLSYKKIAEHVLVDFQISLTADSVRGIVQRLKYNNYISSKSTRKGTIRGSYFSFSPNVCENIGKDFAQTNMHFNANQNHSSFKIDSRINLSILKNLSEEDIKNTFPNLANIGFGTNQIRQIIENLTKKQISLENVFQGMIYAEWELLHKKMKGKQGEEISNPLGYVFKILSHQGSYPKPIGYLSPAEETEINQKQEEARIAKEEADKIKADKDTQKQKLENAKHAWIDSLSEEEKQEKIANYKAENNIKLSIPDKVILGLIYKNIQASKVAENSTASLPFVGTNGW